MSNPTNDPWETEMSRTFDQRVRDLNEAPLNLDQVKGKAVRIRRNRRIAVAGGVLAAAAVIVPVAVFAGDNLNNNSSPPVANPDETATDLAGPGFGYLEGDTLHLADGTTVRLPARYESVTLLNETVFATLNDDATGFKKLDMVDASGTPTTVGEVIAPPVANDEHTLIAYIETDGDLVARWDGGEQTLATGVSDSGSVAAVTGGPGCAEGASGCEPLRVFVSYSDFATPPETVDLDGNRAPAGPDDAIKLNGFDGQLITVQNGSTDMGSCSGVYDLGRSAYVWKTCESYLYDLSPGSRYVDATHPYLDGFGNSYASILDAATGREIIRFDPPEGTITQTTWQDAEHLLALVYGPGGWSIHRIGADKNIEQVLGPNPKGGDLYPAYTLLD